MLNHRYIASIVVAASAILASTVLHLRIPSCCLPRPPTKPK